MARSARSTWACRHRSPRKIRSRKPSKRRSKQRSRRCSSGDCRLRRFSPHVDLRRDFVTGMISGAMLKGFTHGRLACGCRITFREGVEGSPVTVVIDEKSPGCTLSLHVRDLPLFDYREALRPSTRLGPPEEEEFEEEVWAPPDSKPNPDICDERKVVRRNEGRPCPRHFDPQNFHPTGVIDVIEVENREYTWVGPAAPEVVLQVDAVELFAQKRCGQPPRPFIEITKHQFRAIDVPIGHRGCETLR